MTITLMVCAEKIQFVNVKKRNRRKRNKLKSVDVINASLPCENEISL